jgi:hypothetical protein
LTRKLSQASITRSNRGQQLGHVGHGQERLHRIDLDVRIDRAAALGHRLGLVAAVVAFHRRQLPVGVGHADVIGIDQGQVADRRTRQRLHHPRADAAHAHHRHAAALQALERTYAIHRSMPAKRCLTCSFIRLF